MTLPSRDYWPLWATAALAVVLLVSSWLLIGEQEEIQHRHPCPARIHS